MQTTLQRYIELPKERLGERTTIVKRFETQDRLPQLKVDRPEFREVHSLTLQNVVLRVELSFKAFFRRIKSGENPGYPRFKGKGRYDSITYTQSGFGLDSGNFIFQDWSYQDQAPSTD